ncbi:hypothetical protein BKA93DRAFT_81438 [Sparassis latifolia]
MGSLWHSLSDRAALFIIVPLLCFVKFCDLITCERPIKPTKSYGSESWSFLDMFSCVGSLSIVVCSMYITDPPDHLLELSEVTFYKDRVSGNVFFLAKVINDRSHIVGFIEVVRCMEYKRPRGEKDSWYFRPYRRTGDRFSLGVSPSGLFAYHDYGARRSRR